LADDTHIVGPALDVVPMFLRLHELSTLSLSVQPMKCVIWSLQGLDHSISFPFNFLIPDTNFHILGALVGSTSFIELFMAKARHKDFKTKSSFPMFTNLHVAFAMLLLCYAQHWGYLLCVMFPSPDILQHYVEFDIRTIITLKKLLVARSFGGSTSHLVCH
jgi:hypothetical protein